LPEENTDPDDEDQRRRKNLAVLAVAAVIIAIGIYLVTVMASDIQTQNCVMEGRRDCVPMPHTE
jgi:hypothetical protein